MDKNDISKEALGRNFEQLSSEEQFSVRINLAMMKAIQENADPEALAVIAENTSRELWNHYGVGESSEYKNYFEFITDVGFQTAETEELLDELESAGLDPDEYLDR